MVQFVIPGKPLGKQRPRATAMGGHARMFTPKATVSFERVVGEIARPLFDAPINGPVGMSIIAYFQMPKSWTKKQRAALDGTPHTQKPDTSNIAKAIEDGLNRIAYADDSQVASSFTRKLWTTAPSHTVVRVEPLP
jgi:Holliday junction resolvase RusA-like endonuclease